jgi:hypothetical protein
MSLPSNVDQFSDVIALTSFPAILLNSEHSKIGPRDHVGVRLAVSLPCWGEMAVSLPCWGETAVTHVLG